MASVGAQFILNLPAVTRGVSDENWEHIEAAHIEYWHRALTVLHSHAIQVRGLDISVSFDWASVVKHLKRHHAAKKRLYAAAGTPAVYNVKFPRKPVQVVCAVHASGVRHVANSADHLLKAVAESFACDVFLIMNLAAPGCCNFYRATLGKKERPSLSPAGLSLSEVDFDVAYLDGRGGKWPAPQMVSLDAVLAWHAVVRSGVAQVPQSRMEKVLFALLHTSNADNVSPTTVIWLFYALETLFDTKPGENFRTLLSRIALLLSPDPAQSKLLHTELRKLYDLRSAFVHGGLEVIHVLHNEGLDSRVDLNYGRVMDACHFGFRVLLTAIQAVVRNGWREPTFAEAVVGEGSG